MQPHIRVVIAASAYVLVTGRKIVGLYDHAAGRHVRVAAESRGAHVQGYDGDRDARFGGTLPELHDAGDGASLHMEVQGAAARGYDRSASSHFTANVGERLVQLYDHAEGAWYAFDLRVDEMGAA